jgi:hypothetical protein
VSEESHALGTYGRHIVLLAARSMSLPKLLLAGRHATRAWNAITISEAGNNAGKGTACF